MTRILSVLALTALTGCQGTLNYNDDKDPCNELPCPYMRLSESKNICTCECKYGVISVELPLDEKKIQDYSKLLFEVCTSGE